MDLFGAEGLWRVFYLVGILAWAVLEVALGTNLFRRVLGLVVIVWVLAVR